MANESTSSTLSELYTEIVAEALFVASERSVMRPLVKNYAISGGGKAVEVPIYADIGRLFGEAIAKKIDVDLTALFDGFSTEVNDGTAVLSAANIFNAVAQLRKNGVPTADISGVFHPLNAYDLKSNLTNTFGGRDTDLSNEALRNGFVGKVAGVNIFETSNLADSSGNNPGTTGDYKGAVFHKDALGLAMMQDLKIETQRDASLRADEIVATSVYGVGELHDTYGVEMNVDSSIQ